jgi:hypothetical protein
MRAKCEVLFSGKLSFEFLAWFKKGSGTVVRSTLRAVPATVPDPFLNHAKFLTRHLEFSSSVQPSLVA